MADDTPFEVDGGSPSSGTDEAGSGGVRGRVWALVPRSLRRSYARQLLVAFLVLLVLVGGAGVAVQHHTATVLREDVSDRLVLQAEAESAELAEWRERNGVLVRVLSSNRVFAPGANASVDAFLEEQLATGVPDDVRALYSFRRSNDRIVNTTDPGMTLPDLDRVGAFNSFAGVAVSRPYENDRGETVMAFVSPIEAHPETLLVMTVDAGETARDFRHTSLGGFTYVVDSSRSILFAEDERRLLDTYAPGRPYPTALERGTNGTSGYVDDPTVDVGRESGTADATDLVVAYAPVAGTDWVVVKHIPAEKAYRLERSVTVYLLSFVVVTLAAVLAIGATFGYATLSAVRRLSANARAIQGGRYDVDFGTRREDELGGLFRSLANMRDALRDRIRDLDRANERLADKTVAISVLNRMLRHNLRNDMTLIRGYAELLAGDTDEPTTREYAERIQTVSDHLTRQAAKARRIEDVVDHDHDGGDRVDAAAMLAGVAERARERYPDAEVHLDVPDSAPVVGCKQVEYAFENLVENAVVHNDRDATVWLSLVREPEEGSVTATVADDGPGIPDYEAAAIGNPETSLDHASGMGLWLTDFVVDHVGGDLSFSEREGGGTVATVRLVGAEGGLDGDDGSGTDGQAR